MDILTRNVTFRQTCQKSTFARIKDLAKDWSDTKLRFWEKMKVFFVKNRNFSSKSETFRQKWKLLVNFFAKKRNLWSKNETFGQKSY